ncbi:MAG: DUF885 domain-containing protein [Pseudomonadota bacterium]
MAASSGSADRALDAIIAETARHPRPIGSYWEPYGDGSALHDLSFDYSQASAERTHQWIAQLTRLKTAPLTEDGHETREVLLWDLEQSLGWHRHYWLDFPLGPYSSVLSALTRRLGAASLASSQDLDSYLRLLDASPRYIDQITAKLRGQIERNILYPREEIVAVSGYLKAVLADPATQFLPRGKRLSHVSPPSAAVFVVRSQKILAEAIVPALHRLSGFLDQSYLPRAGDDVGLWRFRDGPDYYRFLLGARLSREIDPVETHEAALQTVAEADRDLTRLRREIGFAGSAEAFHEEVLHGARWKAASVDDVAKRFRGALAKLQPRLPSFFSSPPAKPFDVAPQAPELESLLTNGYYQRPTKDDPRGIYVFNGGDLADASWFWAAPLIYHELSPGHHYHLDRIEANAALSPYRRSFISSGFAEGWGEYARSIAVESGVYDDDLLGRYANRLMDRRMAMGTVGDTGMHVKRWTLDQAEQYAAGDAITRPKMRRRMVLADASDFPGLSACYWAGGEEFRRLRRQTEVAAGQAFDIRRYHDTVLSGGIVPFPVLEKRLQRLFSGS